MACGQVLSELLADEARHFLPLKLNAMSDSAPISTQNKQCLLIPTPLHPGKKSLRGFNQSEFIAAVLAERLGCQMETAAVKRARQTEDQKHLTKIQRRSNVRDAFYPGNNISLINGKSLMLVDDVITTGETVHELSRCLLKWGAHSVTVLALARTSPAGNNTV